MNKKTFSLAVLFLIVTSGWLGINVYWVWNGKCGIFGLLIPVICVLVGAGMVVNEFNKKKCRHLDEVNKHKIP